jgi:hypothetical protein
VCPGVRERPGHLLDPPSRTGPRVNRRPVATTSNEQRAQYSHDRQQSRCLHLGATATWLRPLCRQPSSPRSRRSAARVAAGPEWTSLAVMAGLFGEGPRRFSGRSADATWEAEPTSPAAFGADAKSHAGCAHVGPLRARPRARITTAGRLSDDGPAQWEARAASRHPPGAASTTCLLRSRESPAPGLDPPIQPMPRLRPAAGRGARGRVATAILVSTWCFLLPESRRSL